MYGLARLKIPTLAVVQGAAFGGALGLISCCDMAIAAAEAQFCLSEVRIGLAPAVISPFVVKAIGERATRRYTLTAERFDGQRAQQIGLVAECYPAAELQDQTQHLVDNLLLNSPQAMRVSKELLREVGNGELTLRYAATAKAPSRASVPVPKGRKACAPFCRNARPAGSPSRISRLAIPLQQSRQPGTNRRRTRNHEHALS